MCILNWYSDRGFELDLDAEDDDIALRLAAVQVPADGTVELKAGVELDRLEILFKAHVDVSGEPGQIVEATVTLDDALERLTFTAKVEDVETGEVLDFKSGHRVSLPRGVPESGGPRPQAQSEDELDWEDETTLEKMIVAAPETTRSDIPKPTPITFDDEDEEPTEKPGKGLQALLKALVSVDDPEAPEHAPTEPEVNIAALLGAAQAEPTGPDDQAMSAETSAKRFLELLINRDALEIEEGHELGELVPGTVPILAMRATPDHQASVLSEWLLEQPAVADLFVDDEELGTLIEQW